MQFFVPFAEDPEQSERVYRAIAAFVGATISTRRIYKLLWNHHGKQMLAEVGHPLDPYFQTGEEQVLAIFDCLNLYQVCTASRGSVRGAPILAGKHACTALEYFETET